MSGYGIPFGGSLPPLSQNGQQHTSAPSAFSPVQGKPNVQPSAPPPTEPPTPRLETLQVPFNPCPTLSRQRSVQPQKPSKNDPLERKAFEIFSNPSSTQGRFLRPDEVSIDEPTLYLPPIKTTLPSSSQTQGYYPERDNFAQVPMPLPPVTTSQFTSTESQSHGPYPQRNSFQTQGQFLPNGDYMITIQPTAPNYPPPVATTQFPPQRNDVYLESSMHLIVERDYNAALKLIDLVLFSDPNNAKAHSYRAVCFLNIRNPQLGIDSADRALAINSRDMLALITKAKGHYNLWQFGESLKAYQAMLAIDPEDDNAIIGKINSLFYLNKEVCLNTINALLSNRISIHLFGRLEKIKSSLFNQYDNLKTN